MITVKLRGGIGNQMFQYALGRRLSIQYETPLRLDLSWFDSQSKRKFELDNFCISPNVKLKLLPKVPILKKLNAKFLEGTILNRRNVLKEHQSGLFDQSILNCTKNCYLDGFWQSEKYFQSIKEHLYREFMPRNPLNKKDLSWGKKMLTNLNSVAVHIRCGDYLSESNTRAYHYICSPDYYRETIKIMKRKLGKPSFYIFSDDPQWCINNINFEMSSLTIISNSERSEEHEIYLMSLCNHQIISNSTFGWWGAWLNSNPEKTIIAPSNWIRNKSTPDIIPESWLKYSKTN